MKYRAIAYVLLGIAGITVITTVPFMVSYYYSYVNFPVEITESLIYRIFFNGNWQTEHTYNGDTDIENFVNDSWGTDYQAFIGTLMILGMVLGILAGLFLMFSDLDDRIRITGGITSLTGGALGLAGSLSFISFGNYVQNSGTSSQPFYFFVGFYLAIVFSAAFLISGLVYTITSIVRLVKRPNFYVPKPKEQPQQPIGYGATPTYPDTTSTGYGKQFGSYVSQPSQTTVRPQGQVMSPATQRQTTAIHQRLAGQSTSFMKRLVIIASSVVASNYLFLLLLPFLVFQEEDYGDTMTLNIFLDGRFRFRLEYDGEVEIETGHMANLFSEGYPSYIPILAVIALSIILLALIQKLFANTRINHIYTNSMIIGGSVLGLGTILGYLKWGNETITELGSFLGTGSYAVGFYISLLLFIGYLVLGIFLMVKVYQAGTSPAYGSPAYSSGGVSQAPRMEVAEEYKSKIIDDLEGYSFDFEENAKSIKTSDMVYQRQSQITTLKELVGDKEEVDINLLHMVSQISIGTIKEIAVEDLAMVVVDGKLITQQKQNEINAAKKAAKKKKKTTKKK
ncbi:MAG: hypothetical protein ACTSSB_05205 [Candidatus Heimdallarchaeota archaeon]